MAEVQATDKQYHEELRQLSQKGANKKCADCGAVPTNWASCNLGIFICVNCAQVHRGLGTHISKVKSCMGTYTWHPDEMDMMRSIGNEKSNATYLAKGNAPKLDPANMRGYLENKYVKKLWAPQ